MAMSVAIMFDSVSVVQCAPQAVVTAPSRPTSLLALREQVHEARVGAAKLRALVDAFVLSRDAERQRQSGK